MVTVIFGSNQIYQVEGLLIEFHRKLLKISKKLLLLLLFITIAETSLRRQFKSGVQSVLKNDFLAGTHNFLPSTHRYLTSKISTVPSTQRYSTSEILSVLGTQRYPISEIFSVPDTQRYPRFLNFDGYRCRPLIYIRIFLPLHVYIFFKISKASATLSSEWRYKIEGVQIGPVQDLENSKEGAIRAPQVPWALPSPDEGRQKTFIFGEVMSAHGFEYDHVSIILKNSSNAQVCFKPKRS